MFERIVVPVDGSGFGELALPIAQGVASRTGAEIRLVTVLVPLASPHPTEDGEALESERLSQARGEAEEYQANLIARVRETGSQVTLSPQIVKGTVVGALDAHVREVGADLLVMTTHGRGPISRAWLGSVADGLIRCTPCPVLAVRPGDGDELEFGGEELGHILITLDGSPEAKEILPFAKMLSEAFGARLTLLRVIPPHFPLGSSFISHTAHGSHGYEEEEAAAQAALEQEAGGLEAEGFQVSIQTTTAPHPAEGILAFARRESVDLIAMATHGRGGVSRLFLGSVADKVIRGGATPVLLHRTS